MKIMTLNTHSLSEENGLEKLNKVAKFIQDNDVDVIALQEVNQSINADSVMAPSSYRGCHQLKSDNYALALSSYLEDYQWSWMPIKIGFDKFDEGLAIFSKTAIVSTEEFVLTNTDDYYNWKKRAALAIESNGVWIYTVHFGWWDDEDEPFVHQWETLMNHVQDKKNVYIAGDFNAPDDRRKESYDYILQNGWIDTRTLAKEVKGKETIPGKIAGWDQEEKGMRIDYIMSNKKRLIKSHQVIFDQDRVSDHYGIILEEAI